MEHFQNFNKKTYTQARVQEFVRGGAQNLKVFFFCFFLFFNILGGGAAQKMIFFFAFQFLGGGALPPLDTRLIHYIYIFNSELHQ